MSTATFGLVCADVGANPAVVTGYYGMLLKACIFCPEIVVGSPALGDILQLTIACLGSRDPSVCGQLFSCLLKLVQSTIGDQRLISTFQQCMAQLTSAILFAIADTAPAHQLGNLADVLQVRSAAEQTGSAHTYNTACSAVFTGRPIAERYSRTKHGEPGSTAGNGRSARGI